MVLRALITCFSVLCICFTCFGKEECCADRLPEVIKYQFDCFEETLNDKDLVLVNKSHECCCGKIERFTFLFDKFDPFITIPQARKVLLGLITDVLYTINNNPKIAPYLIVHPFTLANVTLRIRFRDPTCVLFYPFLGNVAVATYNAGMIGYDTMNSYSHRLNRLRSESYFEATVLIH